jgi:hypothetical protein
VWGGHGSCKSQLPSTPTHKYLCNRNNKTAEYLPESGFREGGGKSREARNHAEELKSEKADRSESGLSAKGRWKEVYDAELKNDIGKGSLRSFPEVPGLRPPPKGPFERKLLPLCQKMRIKII